MLTAIQVKPDVYWVGALDWNARSFHGYKTEDGITYNAYLIMDEKVTLIDTAKITFKDELVSRVATVIDPSKIDVLICNHVEMDHSGSTPVIKQLSPNVEIYASAPQGVRGLTAHYGDLGYHGVKTGDTLSIGKRTLTFVQTPMVHWPDNMVTYDAYDKILFSNDAFGQHYASSGRFDDENELSVVLDQARKYYANIVQPYRTQAAAAVKAVRSLGPDAIDMIAPAHGVIWRSHVEDILKAYEEGYTSGALKDSAVVVYDSMWGSTDKMAHAIADGFVAAGVKVELMDIKANDNSDVMNAFLDAKYVCVGSPTFNSQMLPTIAGFLCYMKGLSPKNQGRIAIAFGSYGWAPLAQKQIAAEMESVGFDVRETFSENWIPSEEHLAAIRDKVIALAKENA